MVVTIRIHVLDCGDAEYCWMDGWFISYANVTDDAIREHALCSAKGRLQL